MALIGDKFIFIHNPHTGGSSLRAQLKGAEWAHHHVRACDVTVKDRVKFGVCRNPYDWFVSRYEYIRRNPDHYDHDKTVTVSQYLYWYVSKMREDRFLPNSDYYCTQWDYLNGCDQIVKFEFPDKHYIISEITGTKIDGSIKLNSSDQKAQLTYEDRQLIRTVFAIDFEKFGYE